MSNDAEILPPPARGDLRVASDRPARNVATELVGTAVLMLAGPGVLTLAGDEVGRLGTALSFGVGIALAIGVIGAVANPVFTLALLVVREISVRDAVGDWVGQVVGAVVGAAVIWGIDDQRATSAGVNGVDRLGFGELGAVMAAELAFTVVVVIVLLSAISRDHSTPAVATFTGAAYAVGHLALLSIDGGGMNPARSIGSAVFADSPGSAFADLWVFVVVPLVAAVVAVFVWLAIDDAEIDDTLFDGTVIDRD